MRWSNIVKKERLDDMQSDVSILEYLPKHFDLGTPKAAVEYLEKKKLGADFIMSEVIRQTTGIDEVERESEEMKIEQKVLEKLTTIQQEAYQQAYELGLDQGKEKAYQEGKIALDEQILHLMQLCKGIASIKQELVHQNEAHLIRLVFDIASRLAFDHVQENSEAVIQVIKKAVEQAQVEENINILISPKQLEMIEKLKSGASQEAEFLRQVKLEASDKVSLGSCIVETNYGIVDASIEQRVFGLWEELRPSLPKVKSPLESKAEEPT